MSEPEKCTCKEQQYEPHPCPFAQEIGDDHENRCSCCQYCTYQCAMDI